MSLYILKLVPTDLHFHMHHDIEEILIKEIKPLLKAEDVEVRMSRLLEFVDCGTNLTSIRCPICGKEIAMEWWSAAMHTSYEISHYAKRLILLPCCQESADLNDLLYDFPCAFSYFEIRFLNPEILMDKQCLQWIEALCNTSLKVIHAHL